MEWFDVAILPQLGISVALENNKPHQAKGGSSAPVWRQTNGSRSRQDPERHARWRSHNLGRWQRFPQRNTQLYRKDPIIPTPLGKVSSMLVGP
ncbi:hypothetical protein [Spirosoma aerolatum]|uniref:hypothetical protein n=1 Tax=Spirosoma aerolatum TaxID=1211326 RepID=UPI0012D343F2|nr:hypothetical protein [Spirosoma aerolatum]